MYLSSTQITSFAYHAGKEKSRAKKVDFISGVEWEKKNHCSICKHGVTVKTQTCTRKRAELTQATKLCESCREYSQYGWSMFALALVFCFTALLKVVLR